MDLSSCDVGDVGAEALALALASNPGCVGRLDLSNNRVTGVGCKALGRALIDSLHGSGAALRELVVDNNGIGDDGASALAEALACGAVESISLRSCSIQAQGAAAFGRAVASLANSKNRGRPRRFDVDLSGNHFGTRKIKKKAGKFSASVIRDRASSNFKFIGKTLTGAAKRFSSEAMGITADSDDDEEIMGGIVDEDLADDAPDEGKLQACGGHAFAAEVLSGDQPPSADAPSSSPLRISVGLRQCLLDDSAVDALAAAIVGAKNCRLTVDVSMNSLEDEAVSALAGGADAGSNMLASMADRHMDLLGRIADARRRQAEAAEAAFGGSYSDDEFYEVGFDDYDPSDFD